MKTMSNWNRFFGLVMFFGMVIWLFVSGCSGGSGSQGGSGSGDDNNEIEFKAIDITQNYIELAFSGEVGESNVNENTFDVVSDCFGDDLSYEDYSYDYDEDGDLTTIRVYPEKFFPWARTFSGSYQFSSSSLKEESGEIPETTIEPGLELTSRWNMENADRYTHAHGIAVDKEKNIYLAICEGESSTSGKVAMYEEKNSETAVQKAVYNDDLENVIGLSLYQNDAECVIYVCDSVGNQVVELENNNDNLEFVKRYTVAGDDFYPWAVTVDEEKNIYVSDNSKDTLFIFDRNANLIHKWENIPAYWIDYYKGQLYTIDSTFDVVDEDEQYYIYINSYDAETGEQTGSIPIPYGEENGQVLGISNLVVENDLIYFTDKNGGQVFVYDLSGLMVTRFGQEIGINSPFGIALYFSEEEDKYFVFFTDDNSYGTGNRANLDEIIGYKQEIVVDQQ